MRALASTLRDGKTARGCGWVMPRWCAPCSGRTDREKKTLGAKERDAAQRLLFADVLRTVEAQRVVVIDESGTHLGMTPTYARAPRGQRAYDTHFRNYSNILKL